MSKNRQYLNYLDHLSYLHCNKINEKVQPGKQNINRTIHALRLLLLICNIQKAKIDLIAIAEFIIFLFWINQFGIYTVVAIKPQWI